jgi:hypothetical protein
MDLVQAERYFRDRVKELRRSCEDRTPWVFLSASAMLEYLAKIVNGADKKADGYKSFIRDYFSAVRSEYKDFKYKSGDQDLPIQMYHVLRCGIVHNFSLIPDSTARAKCGRDRSIVLCHKRESDSEGWHHLMPYTSDKVADAALFVAEEFVNDIARVVDFIFGKARKDSALSQNIELWLKNHPPIAGGF